MGRRSSATPPAANLLLGGVSAGGIKGVVDYFGDGVRPFVGFEHAAINGANVFIEASLRTLQLEGMDRALVLPTISIGAST